MSQQIFFHTGLSKTGSTFLQHQVFPMLDGAYYLPTIKYRKALSIIPKIQEEKIIVSREFDQQFEREIKKFSKKYPHAKPILVFREPGSWAVSNYKRFVKNGHPVSFTEFIDIENDNGIFKVQDFKYTRYVQILEENFESEPLILLYEDLRKNPKRFLQKLTDFLEVDLNLDQVNLNPKHVSYDEKSLKLVRRLSKNIQFQKKLEIHRKPKGFIYNLYANMIRYAILFGSKPFPKKWFPKEEFINQEEVDAVSKYFEKEWWVVKEKASKIH